MNKLTSPERRHLFLSLVFLLVSALPAWLAFDGIRTGIVKMQLGSYVRSAEPVLFWSVVALYGALTTYGCYLALDVLLVR